MTEKATARILRPANTLKEKVTGGDPNMKIRIDDSVLQSARDAIRNMEAGYESGLKEEILSLAQLFEAALADASRRRGFLNDVVRRSHEIRGQGGTFGFPLISQFASSLHDFASDPRHVGSVHMEIIKAHIDAIQLVLAGGLKHDGGEVGHELKKMLSVAIAKRG